MNGVRALRWAGALALLVAALLPTLSAAAADADAQYREAAAEFHRLRNEPGTQPASWRAVAERFRAVHTAVPSTRRGADALYSAALASREAWRAGADWQDLSRASEQFRTFATRYANDRLADDALMHLAGLHAEGYGDLAAAQELYRRVIAMHPQGDQLPLATSRLSEVEQALAEARLRERAAERLAQGGSAGTEPGTPNGAGGAGGVAARGTARAEAAPDHDDAAGRAADRELAALASARQREHAPGQRTEGGRSVKGVQFWSALEWTRVILTTDPAVDWDVKRLAAAGSRPERVYFDLKGVLADETLAALTAVGDAVLEQIRIGRLDGGTTRVVLDLNQLGHYEVKDFRLPNERKIVVDLHPPAEVLAALRKRADKARVAAAPVAPPALKPASNAALPQPSVQVPLALQVRSIMLDPGHGGHDPGANAWGVAEKDLVLDISRRVRELLAERHPSLRVGLTRDADVFVPLAERPRLAKRFGADLFVSVHLNANPFARFHGVETYFLNLTDDEDSLQVAARENGTSGQRLSDLNDILRDLLRDTTLVESSELAKSVQGALVGTLRHHHGPVRDLGVKQAPFLVLMGAEMPGVLVEAGFLTNREENQRLQDPGYVNRIAEGIYDGLRRYIEQQNIVAAGHSTPALAGASRL